MINEIDEIVNFILKGGIVLIPTDTVYGLAVSPKFEESVKQIYALKRRPRQLNLPIMISSANELENIGIDINNCVKRLLQSPFMPGPLTLAVGFKDKPLVPWLVGREEVAIRIPNDERLLSILEKTGPLFVTSANIHGTPTPADVPCILAQLNGKPDKIIDGGLLKGVPSTLVNCRLNPPVIERHGNIPKAELLKFLE